MQHLAGSVPSNVGDFAMHLGVGFALKIRFRDLYLEGQIACCCWVPADVWNYDPVV